MQILQSTQLVDKLLILLYVCKYLGTYLLTWSVNSNIVMYLMYGSIFPYFVHCITSDYFVNVQFIFLTTFIFELRLETDLFLYVVKLYFSRGHVADHKIYCAQ